jgi:hypothetical protein
VFYPHGHLSCGSGRCGVACDAGYADCDGRYENGCETSITTLNDFPSSCLCAIPRKASRSPLLRWDLLTSCELSDC